MKKAVNQTAFLIFVMSKFFGHFVLLFQTFRFADYTSNEFLFRIKSMLFCEKEFIFQYEKFNRIGHVPYEIFEPLIEKVKDTEEYKLYKLDELFKEYKKMYDLFLEKPYKSA